MTRHGYHPDDENDGQDGRGRWVPPGYARPGDIIDMPPADGGENGGEPAPQDSRRADDGRTAGRDRYRTDFVDCGPLDGDESGARYRVLSGGRPADHGPGRSGRSGAGRSGADGAPSRDRAEVALRHAERFAGRAGQAVRRAGAALWSVARHEHTRRALVWLLRNSIVYPPTGAWVLAVRWWDARTNARYERTLRAMETAGDREGFADWEQRGEQARERRHARRMDWLDAPGAIVRGIAIFTGAFAMFLLGLGVILAVADNDITQVIAPIMWVVHAVAWCVWLVSVLWRPTLIAAPCVLLVACWHLGRTRGALPGWAAIPAAGPAHQDVIVTPGGIAAALAHLGLAPLTRAIKDGWQVEFSTPPIRVNGRGYQAIFTLPMGVTPDMVVDRRDVLARNLHRAPLEVWPAAAERAGQVDLWVSDPGATEKPAPEYPLLRSGTGDVFAGVPCGISQRGDVITLALPGGNIVLGGLMGQGKSNAARIIFAGAALDPLCVMWVFVFAFNGDFDAYAPRLARYRRGTDDATITAAVEALQALYDEMERREARLAALGAKKVTRQLAERHPDLRPIVALFSECHELFGHEGKGTVAADLAVQTMRRARKAGITLIFDTQSSRADAIPPKIVELVKINSCFAVKTWRNNDGFLGDGSFASGVRATELRPGKDVGTSVVTGATPERFEIVKWYFLEVDDDTGYDAATDLIARAMENVSVARRPSRDTEPEPEEEPDEGRDVLDDIAAVVGVHEGSTRRVNAADVAARLRELAPEWSPYQSINGFQIRTYLETEFGITLPVSQRRYPIDPDLIRDLIARRDASDDGGPDGGPTGGRGADDDEREA